MVHQSPGIFVCIITVLLHDKIISYQEFWYQTFLLRDADGLYNFSCIYDMSVNGQEFELSLSPKIIAAPIDTIWFEGQTAEGSFRLVNFILYLMRIFFSFFQLIFV